VSTPTSWQCESNVGGLFDLRSDTQKGTDTGCDTFANTDANAAACDSFEIAPDMSAAEAALFATGPESTCTANVATDSTLRAFSSQILKEESDAEICSILGRQAAHVTKLLDTQTQLKTERGAQAATGEFKRMIEENHVWDDPQELTSVPDNAIVVKGKLLLSIKHDE
jgi:hypothetical protein